MKQTYLFYDIETTGLNKCFDQVLQFAAIRTDLQLNELSREEIHIKLNNDVIPSPYAVITHHIGVNDFQKGITEYEAIQKIHALINTPGTISVGYNTLGFDDEFLRFSFYRNLLPPYTHQYANHCGRMDIYPITLLYYLFKQNHLNWPNNNGTINLKLENLNHCNQFFEGKAHNAMVDVEVTLALAKKLFEDQTMWQFVTDYFQKKTDEQRIADHTFGFMINGKIGSASQFIAPVMTLGQHQHYKNQSLWLRLDDPNLSNIKIDDIAASSRILKKRLGEPPIFLPLKDRYWPLLSDERKSIFEKNKNWIENHTELLQSIKDYYQHEKYENIPNRDTDAALYDIGFPTPTEEKSFQQFHKAKPAEKEALATTIQNKIRKEQAIRIIGRHFPENLSAENKAYFNQYRESLLIDYRGEKKLSKTTALLEIETLLQQPLNAAQQKLLEELKLFFS
jgi:exodeoxyribonuclease-1